MAYNTSVLYLVLKKPNSPALLDTAIFLVNYQYSTQWGVVSECSVWYTGMSLSVPTLLICLTWQWACWARFTIKYYPQWHKLLLWRLCHIGLSLVLRVHARACIELCTHCSPPPPDDGFQVWWAWLRTDIFNNMHAVTDNILYTYIIAWSVMITPLIKQVTDHSLGR